MSWPRDVMLRERHFSRGQQVQTNLHGHSNPGLSEMDKTVFINIKHFI